MGISISGSNAISGLGGNDTDFDKVLSQLKEIESTQLNRLEAWKSDWNLRYEAFTQIIEQVQAASSMLSQLSDKNNFVKKLVQSTNEGVITAVANASAQDVQHSINVTQVASNAIWANNYVYGSKTDIINTSGADAYFNYTYAGKEHSFKVPANTSLESFANMFNNSADNPGLKISIIQTGKGYVFQVAGKETGAANDLVIHDSKLLGMDAVNSTSNWITNDGINLSETVTNPTSYVFDLVLENGSKKSITIKGDASPQDVVNALNNAAGGIKASVDSNGNLTIEGVKSFSRRKADDAAYTPASTQLTIKGDLYDKDGKFAKLNADDGIAAGLKDDDLITFTLTLDDGTTREVRIKAGATKRDLFSALSQASGGKGIDVNHTADGTSGTLAGVKNISAEVTSGDKAGTDLASELGIKVNDSKGVKNTLGGSIASATTTITFDKDKLDKRIDGKTGTEKGDELVFTVVDKDGNARNIYGITGDMTNQEMLDKIKASLEADGVDPADIEIGTDSKGNSTLKLNGFQSFELSGGSVKNQAWTTETKTTTTISATHPSSADPADNLFYTDVDGKQWLEKAPDLVYTFKANNGSTGTLTIPSGASMKEIMAAIGNPSGAGWEWKNPDDTPGSPPADWAVHFTDADGNEITDLDQADGPVYLNLKNVQIASGPGIKGQVESSSNWTIQRAANARYTVDNWPVEMESTTNSISDVIEGVVFSIQDVGDARISVSTDITSVEESIQNFLDAVNSVLLTVNDLMKYDEDKELTSNDPNDKGNSNYSPSGLTNQKGGLLMGNYGVQLFKSRFSSLLGTTPPGFKSRQSADDVLSGDVLASLANLGIKTDTDATSDTYGLLVIGPSSSIAALQSMDKENYTDMINNNLEAVVDFFCASGSGASTSTDFRYGSHVEGITKAGNYEVKYEVLDDGTITNVTVGGVPAKQDISQPGNYFSVASGDARGLSILIDDLTVGKHPPEGAEPMYVRIKQGLVQTTNNFLKDELVFNDVNISSNSTPSQIADAIALKSKNGALMSLRDNYKTIMEGIDVKIEREQRRLDTWERRQKAIFANLETLLKQYDQQQTSLEQQLKQLSSNKS